MRINIESTPDETLRVVQQNINKVFTRIGFEYVGRVSVRVYTTEFPKVLANPLPKPVTDLHLTYLRNMTDDSPPAAGVFVDWIPDPNGIRIRNITGLTAGKSYELRFVVYA